MQKKTDTEKLEHQLEQVRMVQDFWRDNELELQELTLADFLSQLLAKKGLDNSL